MTELVALVGIIALVAIVAMVTGSPFRGKVNERGVELEAGRCRTSGLSRTAKRSRKKK